MGKKTKEHRRKVEKRNARIKNEKNLMEKLYREAMNFSVNELKEKLANVETSEEQITKMSESIADEVVDAIVEETTQTEETSK
jgi:ethanolamine ammonia-lyase large subunit